MRIAEGAHLLVGGGGDADVVHGEGEGGGESLFHGRDVRGDHRLFGDDADGHIADYIILIIRTREDLREKFHTVRAIVTRIVYGEEVSDVRIADCGEDRVHERVHGHIAIAVCDKRERTMDFYAEEACNS